jgi:putative endonuclease
MDTHRTGTFGDAALRQADARPGRGDPTTTPRDAGGRRDDPRRKLGALGERLAREHLEARGFEILEANFRTRLGELDVVARNERFLVFCEVKTRIRRGERRALGPFASIGSRKRRRVRMMAREWLAARKITGPRPPEIRFDAIGVELAPSGRLVGLEHLENAF